jgi:hypothetical protein
VACTAPDESAPPVADFAGTITDSAGVIVVVNPEGGLWTDEEAWTVREEWRIGNFGGDPRYQFAQVGGVALTAAGHLWVMDRQTRELREFDAEGTFLRSFGTSGEGPGEFGRGVAEVFAGVGDTLLVPDVRNRRIQRFDPEGRFIDAAPLDVAAYRAMRFRWNAAARRGVAQVRPAAVLEEGATAAVRDELRPVLDDGTLGELLVELPTGGLLAADGALRYFTPEPVWGLTDSLTVAFGLNDRYRIAQYDREGRLRRVVARSRDPRPLSDRDLRAFYAYLDRAWLDAGVTPAQLAQNRARVSFAEHLPAFADIRFGPEGTMWVQPVQAPGELTDEEIERYNFIEDFGASDWDVHDREGRFLGIVRMPPRVQPRLFAGDVVYAVARDELDVQYVVRLRIER